MSDTSRTTTDHEEIRRWVEEHGGTPAAVEGTGGGVDPGVLRLAFPGYGDDERLTEISWEDWFAAFEDNGLALLYQPEHADGEDSTFNKIVSR
jgi:hypothetical protein